MKNNSKQMTVAKLIESLRLFDPASIVVLKGIRDYVDVGEVEAIVLWRLDDPLYDTYTEELVRASEAYGRGEGYSAVVLNAGYLAD